MDGARYLEDGKLTIFRRWGIYYARIRLASQKYFWRSLKTTDEANAIRAGRKLLYQVEERVEIGLPLKSKLFSAVIDDYVRYRERDHAHGRTSDGMLRQIIRVSKFWREYAGAMPVEAIDDKVMREFIPWRRDYYSKFKKLPKNARRHPKDKTLQWDMMLGKAIVKWAADQGLRAYEVKNPQSLQLLHLKRSESAPPSKSGNSVSYGARCASGSIPPETGVHTKAECCCAFMF
jgi:hypothetical protein